MNKRARGTHTDPLSAASAGLLALGLPLHLRTNALDLLAHMLDLASEDGKVELDAELLAVEERMGVTACLDSYSWLETLGVACRTSSGWEIPAFAQHQGPLRATAESFAVLRRHLDTVGDEASVPALALVPDASDGEPNRAGTPRRWRRSVPMAAAGIAASVAALAGAAQLIPQAAVTGRNVALSADAPTSSVSGVAATLVPGDKSGSVGAKQTPATTASALATSPTTGAPLAIICAVPQLVAEVTQVRIQQLPLARDDKGAPVWAALVSGMLRNTTADSVVVQGLTVVAHVVDGDTAPVDASFATPLMLGNAVTPFSAVIALGAQRPATGVSATAEAVGNRTSC